LIKDEKYFLGYWWG